MRESLGRCPICLQPAVKEYRPFCSRRCADVDLGKWLTGQYRVRAHVGEPDEEAPSAAPENPD
jgi:uncharacterized protein